MGKKLVVQYSLVRDPSSGGSGDQGRSAYSDAYSAAVIRDAVKVKARVEVSRVNLLSLAAAWVGLDALLCIPSCFVCSSSFTSLF